MHKTRNMTHKRTVSKLLIVMLIITTLLPISNARVINAATATQALGQALADAITGNGVKATNITYTGNAAQGATFADADFLPFSDGIILSTGNASDVFGAASGNLSQSFNGAGDAALTAIYQETAGTVGVTHDAVSLQFNVTPTSNKLSFRYIFASEEYDQGPKYNDVFALFVDGQNIAKLPDGKTVSIQNTINTASHIDNSSGMNIKFLGYTTELSCEANVTPGVPVTIRLVIADAADAGFDSAVFVKASSINFVAADAPVLSSVPTSVDAGDIINVTSSKEGNIYLAPKGTYADKAALDEVGSVVVPSTANVETNIDTSGLPSGTYQVYAVDTSGNISAPSTDITINGTVPTPPTVEAPNVTTNDDSNKLVGIDDTMEYSIDNGVSWIPYDSSNEPTFTGDVTVLVRVKATDSTPAGNVATVNFTADVLPPAPPIIEAPNVTTNDGSNKLVGVDNTMEYSIDNGISWIPYNSTNEPTFSGDVTVLVRVKATDSTPAGNVATVNFTADTNTTPTVPTTPTEPTTPTVPTTPSVPTTPTTTDTNSNGSVRQVEVTLEDEKGTSSAAKIDITRKTENDLIIDSVNLDEAKTIETLKNITESQKDTVRIQINDLPNDKADEVLINIAKNSVQRLTDANVSLEIMTEYATITLTQETLESLVQKGEDLFFRVVPIRSTQDRVETVKNTLESPMVKEYTKYKEINVYGTPMTIETNYKDHKTKVIFSLAGVTLPNDKTARDKILKNLAVYVQHSDGDKEIIPGTIIYNSEGTPVGVQIEITKFSTFTLLSTTNFAPTAKNVTITGDTTKGATLTASYSFSDLDNEEQGNSIYQWYRADDAKGTNRAKIVGADKVTYKVTGKDQGKYLTFEIIPVSKDSDLHGKSVTSSVQIPSNSTPTITGMRLSGNDIVGNKLTVSYNYFDAENDKQGTPSVKWYRSDNANGKGRTLIKGAKSLTYTLTKADQDKYITCEVIPVAKAGTVEGNAITVTTDKAVQQLYKAHINLGLIGSKNYATKVANLFIEAYHAGNVQIKKMGSYYKVSADFATSKDAIKTCKDMKAKDYIVNYYLSDIK